MKLYYSPGTCALADHIVLEWIGKPFEVQRISREERKQPAYLKINPAGAVPALEKDGWVLTQNAAILNYLADLNPEARLGGDGTPEGRAEVNRWLGIVNSDIHPEFKAFFGATAYLEDPAIVEKTQQHAREVLRTLFERVDAQLDGREWVVGTRSIVDPYLFVTLRWAKSQGVDLSGLKNLVTFEQHMRADPGVQRALKEQGID